MSNSILKILLVEDNPGDTRLLQETFAEIDEPRFELISCETLAQALDFLAKNKPDAALVDLGLPDAQGLEAVGKVHNAAPDVPLVVLTGLDDETLAVQALKQGAQDYLVKVKVNHNVFRRVLRYAMERQRVQLELLNLSLLDDLTGLNNRRGFLTLGEHQLKLAYRTRKPFLIAFVDLDGMKQINDTYGHQEGNRALLDATRVLQDSFRQSDIIGRIGGDEFAIFVADAAESSIETVSRRLEQKLKACNAEPGRLYDLSLSIGIVAYDATNPAGIEGLLHQADELMYAQKQKKGAARAVQKKQASV
jgi:diguanylate cyclase (GGDEF)-like protein